MPRVTLKSLQERAAQAEQEMVAAQEEYRKQVEGSQGGDEAAMKASESTYREMEAKVDAWRKAHAAHQQAAAFAGPAAGPDHEVDVPDRDAPPAAIPAPPSAGPSGYSPPVPTDQAPAPAVVPQAPATAPAPVQTQAAPTSPPAAPEKS